MGYLYETKQKILRVEGRSESVNISQKKGRHIFVYGFDENNPGQVIASPTDSSVSVELTHEILKELYDFMKKHPEIRGGKK